MEDLWGAHDSANKIEDLADIVDCKRFLNIFCNDEEKKYRRRGLFGEEDAKIK